MQIKLFIPLVCLSCMTACKPNQSTETTMSNSAFHPEQFQAPTAPEKPKELTVSGDTRVDPYYWLNERENPEVTAFLEAENRYADSVLAPVKQLKEDLFLELKSRIKEDDSTVPYLKKGYYYYTRFETGKEYPIYCRKKGSLEGQEEVLLNVNQLASGHAYILAGNIQVSPDDHYMTYIEDTTGRNLFTAYIKDLRTGQLLPDRFETAGGVEWINDSKTIIFETKDPVTLRTDKIWRHRLGATKDELLFEEKDETAYCSIGKSKSDAYLFLNHGYTQNIEAHFMSADDPNGRFTLIKPREKEFYYSIEHFGSP